jgi:hypothetical protein
MMPIDTRSRSKLSEITVAADAATTPPPNLWRSPDEADRENGHHRKNVTDFGSNVRPSKRGSMFLRHVSFAWRVAKNRSPLELRNEETGAHV